MPGADMQPSQPAWKIFREKQHNNCGIEMGGNSNPSADAASFQLRGQLHNCTSLQHGQRGANKRRSPSFQVRARVHSAILHE